MGGMRIGGYWHKAIRLLYEHINSRGQHYDEHSRFRILELPAAI